MPLRERVGNRGERESEEGWTSQEQGRGERCGDGDGEEEDAKAGEVCWGACAWFGE